MFEDKEAIKAIAQIQFCLQNCNMQYSHCKKPTNVCRRIFKQEREQNGWPFVTATEILQTLHSLDYVRMVEQKLPELPNHEGHMDSVDGKNYPIYFTLSGSERLLCKQTQQDMLSVDAESCAYRRVRVKSKESEKWKTKLCIAQDIK